MPDGRRARRLFALALFGLLAFNFPVLLAIDTAVGSGPGLIGYLFGAWIVIIAVLALLVEQRSRRG